MATQSELEELQIQEANTLPVHTDLSDLMGHSVIVYNQQTGMPMAFDADKMSGRARVVVGTEAEIEAMTKQAGVFYCTYE